MATGVAALVFGRDAFARFTGPLDTSTATGGVYTPQPVDLAAWRLTVDGQVDSRLKLSWDELLALSQTDETRDFQCVDGWRAEPRRWIGVRLRDLLVRAGVQANATHVVFHSADKEYTDSLTIAQALAGDVLLAHTLDGEALTQDHGSPLRLVTPGRYGYKYVKWLTRIEVVAAGPDGYRGYYEGRGYSADALME